MFVSDNHDTECRGKSCAAAIFCTVWIIALLLFSGIASSTPAQNGPQVPDRLRVGVTEFPPYTMKTDDGKWEGLSIELMQAVAKEMNIEYGVKEFSRLKQVIEAIQNEELDVTPMIAVTEDNETVMDLSHSYFRSGFAVAVPQNSSGFGWIGFVKRFTARDTLKVVVLLLLLALIAGAIIWCLGNKKNREMFGGKLSQGIGNGIWWAMVTMTTVGYGDKAPRTIGGRVVAVVWMFFSIILVTSYTAVITVSFTVDELSGKVRSPQDLPGARVGAFAKGEAVDYLTDDGIPVVSF
jgi:ABC-type amino acid transport substrate-binding protein